MEGSLSRPRTIAGYESNPKPFTTTDNRLDQPFVIGVEGHGDEHPQRLVRAEGDRYGVRQHGGKPPGYKSQEVSIDFKQIKTHFSFHLTFLEIGHTI